MELKKIVFDCFLNKDVKKFVFEKPPKLRIFNEADIITGNTSSNIAIAFVYNWKTDFAPKHVLEFFQRVYVKHWQEYIPNLLPVNSDK